MMEVVSKEILNLSLFLQQKKIDLVKASETVCETINNLQSIMDESDTIVYNALYCKASVIARINNILIATRWLHITANEDTKEYYYRIYRNYVGSVVEQL